MKQKNHLPAIIAGVVLLVVVIIIVAVRGGGEQIASGVQEDGSVVFATSYQSSENGSTESVGFQNALAVADYDLAARYVQTKCEGQLCLYQGLSKGEVMERLEGACRERYCGYAVLEKTSNIEPNDTRFQELRSVNEVGEAASICLTEDCSLSRATYNIRTIEQDGKWYVLDLPPAGK